MLLDWLEGPSDPGAPCVPFKPQQLMAATTCVTLWTFFLKIFPIWILDFFCWSGPTESSSICSSHVSSSKPNFKFALHLSWEDLFWLIWGTLLENSTIWQSLTPGIEPKIYQKNIHISGYRNCSKLYGIIAVGSQMWKEKIFKDTTSNFFEQLRGEICALWML